MCFDLKNIFRPQLKTIVLIHLKECTYIYIAKKMTQRWQLHSPKSWGMFLNWHWAESCWALCWTMLSAFEDSAVRFGGQFWARWRTFLSVLEDNSERFGGQCWELRLFSTPKALPVYLTPKNSASATYVCLLSQKDLQSLLCLSSPKRLSLFCICLVLKRLFLRYVYLVPKYLASSASV